MKTAPLPANESERLETLLRYRILDTPAEPAFDELTRLASQICDCPIAMISLVDRDRQWFKSRLGWDSPETPRSISFCAHAILETDPLIVPDLTADDRFQGNPLVEEKPQLRFYAGAPLTTSEGWALGALSVMGYQPAVLTPGQVDSLRILARQVMAQLDLRRHLDELARTIENHRRIEQRLRDSESFYQTLVESLPQNIIRKDTQGRFTFANQKFCQSIGRPLEALLDRTDFDLYPSDLAGKYHRDDLRVMASKENLDTIEAHQTPHGDKLFVHVLKTPLYDAQGKVAGIQGIFWDVTQRKRIEEALAYERDLLRALLDNIPDRIYFKDVHSRFLRCSTSLARHLGLSDPREVVGKTDFDLHPRELAQEYYNDEQRIILTGRPLINKLEKHFDPTGAERWASVTKVPVYNQAGAVTGIIGISRDVTQLKTTERELEQARDAALESVRVKSQFLANMSHEIRTPMNAITGMTGLLKHTSLTPEQSEYADTISDSTATLLAIINEILDYSKLEAGKVSLEQIDFDLRDAVESTSRMLADPAQRKGLELACWIDSAVPTRLRGDPGRFRQVLANLLSNAVKFTDTGEVLIRVTLCEATESRAVIHVAVSDTGIGIEPHSFPLIFEAFTQADGSTTRKFGGTGLGLTISRHLVELMGGEIGVQSQLGQGSCFWVRIPFEKQPSPAPESHVPLWPSLTGKRVLVVDDSTTCRQILLDLLGTCQMETVLASNHDEAVQKLNEFAERGVPFQLVLVDLEMPDGNGLNLAYRLRADTPSPSWRFVAMTSYQASASVEDMRSAGIAGRLIKPIRLTRLLDCLHRVLTSEETSVFERGDTILVQTANPPPPPAPARPQAARILLAEDNAVNQRVALSQLVKLGYVADAVPNGQQALEAMRSHPYDIVLMDCQMPEMDGYEACRQLRGQFPDRPNRPYIIALTANSMQGDRERCLEAGMNDYLNKPIDIHELDTVLQRAFQQVDPRLSPPAPASSSIAKPNPSLSPDRPLDRSVLETLKALATETDPSPLTGLIELYLRDSNQRMAQMEQALAGGHAEKLAAAAHALKGSSNNLGARYLGECCGRLEKAAKTGELDQAAHPWSQVRDAFHQVQDALAEELRRT